VAAAIGWAGGALAQVSAPKVMMPVFTAPVKVNPVVTAPSVPVTAPVVAPTAPVMTTVPIPPTATTVPIAPVMVKEAVVVPAKPVDTAPQGTTAPVTAVALPQRQGSGKPAESTGFVPGRSKDDVPGDPFPTERASWPNDPKKPDGGGGGRADPPPPVTDKGDDPRLPPLVVDPRPALPAPGGAAVTRLAAAQLPLYLPKPTVCEVIQLPDPARRRPNEPRR
jgi:hypothetical protein